MPEALGRVLVTGATGFIGSALTRALAAEGADVHALVRRTGTPTSGVTLHEVADAVDEVPAVLEHVRPDVVVHLATLFAAQHSPAQVRAMVDSNVALGAVVAEGCTRSGARLVHATSAWQHLDGADYSPVSLYAATKQALVDVVRYYTDVEGLQATEVCLFDTYGPRDGRRKLVWLLLDHARSGTPLAMSSGRQLVDLTHVDDVVAALRLAATGAHDGARMVVRSNQPITVRGLVDLVGEVTGRPLDVTWQARPDRPREMYTDWPVPGAPTQWRPAVNLPDGLTELWRKEFS